MRPFHEHYMPSRNILLHALNKIETYPIDLIAPQHGSIIPKKLIPFMINQLKNLDCGLYLMTQTSTDIVRLTKLNQLLRNFMETMVTHRDFNDITKICLNQIKEVVPAIDLKFHIQDSDKSITKIEIKNISGREASNKSLPEELKNVLGWKDHDASAPYMDEVTIGFEREIFEDWSVSIRYIKKWDRNLLEDADITGLDMDALMDDGQLVWTNWTQVSVTDPYDNSTHTFWQKKDPTIPSEYALVNPPGAIRDYDGLEIIVNKRYSNGWQLNVSYVYSNSRGTVGTSFGASSSVSSLYDNPNAHINADGRFGLERRHQFKLTGVVRGPWGLNFGTYFRYMSGNRYTRSINSTDLGLELSQGGSTSIYAETLGSQGLPDFMALDIKIEKSFKFGPVNFRAFVDIFNVTNNNKATGVYSRSSHPSLIYQEMTSIQTPRIFRVGAKIEF